MIIIFSPTGASLVKVEENGNMGLAQKMPPSSRHGGHLQDHQVLVWLVEGSDLQTQPGQNKPPNKGCALCTLVTAPQSLCWGR